MNSSEEFNVQLSSRSFTSFPSNSFNIEILNDEIIVDFIFDDNSSDPAICFTAVFSKNALQSLFLGIKGVMENYKNSFSVEKGYAKWGKNRKLQRMALPVRAMVVTANPVSDYFFLSVGEVHPYQLFAFKKEKLQSIDTESNIEISMTSRVFVSWTESVLEALTNGNNGSDR